MTSDCPVTDYASTELYDQSHRALQAEFDTSRLADVMEAGIVSSELSAEQQEFIGGRDFFFLSTIDEGGWPTVSYKGGPVGVVRVIDDTTLAFPVYDGNGMFLSAGNAEAQGKIGLLFIDFETPNRLRVHATASLIRDEESLGHFPGALLVVKAAIASVFVNCARYIHKHERVADSPYIPDDAGDQRHPSWKRIDMLQPFLPDSDSGRTEVAGGTISAEVYADHLKSGTS